MYDAKTMHALIDRVTGTYVAEFVQLSDEVASRYGDELALIP